MTYFCSIGSQILYIFETHGIGQTPSSLERYLVFFLSSSTVLFLKRDSGPDCAGTCVNDNQTVNST